MRAEVHWCDRCRTGQQSRRVWASVVISFAWAFASGLTILDAADAPTRLPRDQLLVYRDAQNQLRPVQSTVDFEHRATEIRRGLASVMGPWPGPEKRVPLAVEVEEEVDAGRYVRRKITYTSEPGCRVSAYLCLPKRVWSDPTQTAPAVLCLHPTDNTVGHGVVVGLGGRANRQYAAELAERGFITLSPSYPLLAQYQPDVRGLGWQSGTLKAVWDNARGLDLLDSMSAVSPKRYAAIGHSLGGHNAVYSAVFDDRIQVVISSCGLDSFLDYYDGNPAVWQSEKGWCQLRYMPRLVDYRGRLAEIPFDFHELIGLLAPRQVLIVAPTRDRNFRAASVDRIVDAARPVFALHQAADRLQVTHPEADHDFPDAERERAYRLIGTALGTPTVP